MNLVSLRIMGASLGVIGFIACGSSNSKVGEGNNNGFENPDSSVGSASTGSSSGSSGTDSGTSSGTGTPINEPPPAAEAGACPTTCTQDTDCAACGTPSDGGVYCCGAGACYPSASATCDDDAGSSDDGGGTPAPAPSN